MTDSPWIAKWIACVAEERARTVPPEQFQPLPVIPAGRYIDPEFFALERDAVWRRTWLYAGHIDQLPDPGSYFLWTYGSAPVVVLRGDDGAIRAFYNTCRHRGAPVIRATEGRVGTTLVCGYHGWSYDRQGKLRAVTDRRDWAPFDFACYGLSPVRCEIFGTWIFVCEDANAQSLAEFLAPAARYFQHLPLDKLRLVNRRSFDVACNAKVLIDNFLEAYHFRLLHAKTTDRIFDNLGTSIHLWPNGHSIMLSPNRRADWVDPGTLGMPEMRESTAIERHHNPSYCVFPNFIVPISPTGMPSVTIWPRTVRTSSVEVLWFAPSWGEGPRPPLWDTRVANFDRIVDEDIQFAEPMQHTIESPGFRGVPLNYQERRIYHWHEEIDRRIGVDRVPAALRVEPMLARFVE